MFVKALQVGAISLPSRTPGSASNTVARTSVYSVEVGLSGGDRTVLGEERGELVGGEPVGGREVAKVALWRGGEDDPARGRQAPILLRFECKG